MAAMLVPAPGSRATPLAGAPQGQTVHSAFTEPVRSSHPTPHTPPRTPHPGPLHVAPPHPLPHPSLHGSNSPTNSPSTAQVYLASASPPVRYPNVYGVDMPTRNEFVAHDLTEEEICK